MIRSSHRSEFVRQLKLEIPESVEALRGYRGNLTMEMLAFLVMTNEGIARGHLDLVRRCFSFADRVLAAGNRQVRKSLAVSFLEHLDFSGAGGREAEALLTPALRLGRESVLSDLEAVLRAGSGRRTSATEAGSSRHKKKKKEGAGRRHPRP
jgi:hypothetical protein